MDLREIQRLHAQFAPDTVTIDLTGQIAALPSPASERREPSYSVGKRWSNAGPLVRRCTISLVAAAVLASAGVGAAVLYRSFQSYNGPSRLASVNDVRGELPTARLDSSPKSPAKLREIDAAEPTQISAAPLTASDLAGTMSLGLTSDQFRHNLGNHSAPAQAPQSGGSTDEQLAMVSPIRSPSARVAQPASTSIAPAVAESVPKSTSGVTAPPAQVATVQPVPQQIVASTAAKASSATTPAQTRDAAPVASAAPAIAASAPIPKAARAVHHRAIKHHEAHPDQDATASSDPSKPTPSPAKASGSNEVQMF
ncbi:hypothetical protein SAMN05414139_10696 [Burkholderia sp. D7]|nr:hypothetical protein SAMN05414139_10696 [Burkholderia sp. D7]